MPEVQLVGALRQVRRGSEQSVELPFRGPELGLHPQAPEPGLESRDQAGRVRGLRQGGGRGPRRPDARLPGPPRSRPVPLPQELGLGGRAFREPRQGAAGAEPVQVCQAEGAQFRIEEQGRIQDLAGRARPAAQPERAPGVGLQLRPATPAVPGEPAPPPLQSRRVPERTSHGLHAGALEPDHLGPQRRGLGSDPAQKAREGVIAQEIVLGRVEMQAVVVHPGLHLQAGQGDRRLRAQYPVLGHVEAARRARVRRHAEPAPDPLGVELHPLQPQRLGVERGQQPAVEINRDPAEGAALAQGGSGARAEQRLRRQRSFPGRHHGLAPRVARRLHLQVLERAQAQQGPAGPAPRAHRDPLGVRPQQGEEGRRQLLGPQLRTAGGREEAFENGAELPG
ncbi:MAG TPA: hypothetical protein DD417_00445 [Elusimicrobia bacterium]|nr:hypothetical protein [Elusimicrobiota bacterium]